ncbi:unnamed protein product, partial [Symbiodinium necroappetens]
FSDLSLGDLFRVRVTGRKMLDEALVGKMLRLKDFGAPEVTLSIWVDRAFGGAEYGDANGNGLVVSPTRSADASVPRMRDAGAAAETRQLPAPGRLCGLYWWSRSEQKASIRSGLERFISDGFR